MQIFVSKNGQQYGPYTIEQLRGYVRAGNFNTADQACCDGQNWVTVAQIPGLMGGAATKPQTTPPTAPKPTKTKKKWSCMSVILAIGLVSIIGSMFTSKESETKDEAPDPAPSKTYSVEVDLSAAEKYTVLDDDDYDFGSWKRKGYTIVSDAVGVDAKAQTTMKAAIELQRSSGANSVTVTLGLKKYTPTALVYFTPDGRGWAKDKINEVWDVRVAGDTYDPKPAK